MSDEMKKMLERSIDGLLARALEKSPFPNRDFSNLDMSELTNDEMDELFRTHQRLEQMGIMAVRERRLTGREPEEYQRIVTALDQYSSLMKHGGRVSSTMELVQYLIQFRSNFSI